MSEQQQAAEIEPIRTDVIDSAADALDRLAAQGIAVPCDPEGIPVPPDWFRAYLLLPPAQEDR